jgi:hypothetical protein
MQFYQSYQVGFDCSKRTYFCKYCQHKFRQPSLLKGVKFSSELITLTLGLYFSRLSLRKTVRNVSDHFSIDINFFTIYDWIQRSSIEGDTYQLQKYVYIHQEETKVTLKALLY